LSQAHALERVANALSGCLPKAASVLRSMIDLSEFEIIKRNPIGEGLKCFWKAFCRRALIWTSLYISNTALEDFDRSETNYLLLGSG
jgi:hypothetical protein